jgi:hypothetical protein
MELTYIYMVIGFTLAAYSVVANDSVQTLGTFIASNSDKFKWYILAGAASLILCLTLLNGWYFHGDISYGRLNKIPFLVFYFYLQDLEYQFLLHFLFYLHLPLRLFWKKYLLSLLLAMR